MFKKYYIYLALFIFASILVSCSTKSPDDFDDERALFEHAQNLFEKKNYTDSATFFESFKNKYPTSSLIAQAEYKLAESHFRKKDYIEAIYSFQNFKYLHPTNQEVPEATYKIALSYYKQIPRTIDRDQSDTRNCINTLKDLILRYPAYENIGPAKELLAKCERKLAKREMYIADFYLNQHSYKAALGRLKSLKDGYPFKDLRQEATYKLAYSYHKLKDRDKAIENLNELLSMNPDDPYKKKASKLIGKLENEKGE